MDGGVRRPARAPRLFARTETLGETLEVYRERVQEGVRNVSAAYELAAAIGRAWQPGDQVSYYVAGRGASVAVAECARLLSAWDPARPDENTEYYRAKVWETGSGSGRFIDFEGLRPPSDRSDPRALAVNSLLLLTPGSAAPAVAVAAATPAAAWTSGRAIPGRPDPRRPGPAAAAVGPRRRRGCGHGRDDR